MKNFSVKFAFVWLCVFGLACAAVAQDVPPSPTPSATPALPPVKMTVTVDGEVQGGEVVAPAPDGPALVDEGARDLSVGNFDAALACFNQALALNPGDKLKAVIYNDLGGFHAYKGERDQALEFFNKAVLADPQLADAWSNLGGALDAKGDHAKAMEAFDKAVALNPQSAAALFNRGRALDAAGEEDKALADLNEAVRLKPDSAWPYLVRGLVYDKQGAHEKAIADYDNALSVNPKFPEAYTSRGTAYSDSGDYAKAKEDFAAALALNPKFPIAMNNMAWLLATCPDASVRDGKKAVEYAQQACDLTQGKDAGCVDTLAGAYAEAGDFDNAVKYEQQYITAIGEGAKDEAPAKARLALYQAHKAYHEEAKKP
jgi:tetratricopeptide (TPR) repeat protein